MELSLTTGERLQLLGAINVSTQRTLDLNGIRLWSNVMNVLALTDKEKDEVGYREEFRDGVPIEINWNDKTRMFDLEFDSDSIRLLSSAPAWKCWSMEHKVLVERLEALNDE